jgi:hypothetical protein
MEEVWMAKEDTIVEKALVQVRTIVISLEDQFVKRHWELTQKLRKTNDFQSLRGTD